MTEQQATEEFWRWWAGGAGDRLAAAFDSGSVEGVAEEVTPRVKAIHPALAWEFGPGLTSRHRLVVTAEGDPEVRAVARRWLRAAPAADPTWSFHDLRQPGGVPARLTLDGQQLATDRVRVAARPAGGGLDVVVHHPDFGSLSEGTPHRVAFVLLDGVLGEELVELWIGRVEVSSSEPPGSEPLDRLPALLAEVVAAGTDERGALQWKVLRGQGPEGPVLATCCVRLSSVQAPECDLHVAVEVTYTDRTEEGWPGPSSLDRLRDLEDHLVGIAGEAGRLVAVVSSGGRRVLHFYADSTYPVAQQLEAAAAGWSQGPVSVVATRDPSWSAVGHLRA